LICLEAIERRRGSLRAFFFSLEWRTCHWRAGCPSAGSHALWAAWLEACWRYAGNARQHSDKQIDQLKTSISRNGFLIPILIDAENNIIAGYARFMAAKALGLNSIPAIRVSHLTPEQQRAFIIADNRLAELATWDKAVLASELRFLSDMNFDLELTFFSTAEIDLIIDDAGKADEVDQADDIPEPPRGNPVTRVGDIWMLGRHRIVCGDSTDADVHRMLMRQLKADMIFCDPPYNVKVSGHVCGLGKIKHDEFAMASGEMTPAQFIHFLSRFMALMCQYSTNGSIHYICMDWRHLRELLAASADNYTEFKQLVVWNKDNAGMGAFYRSKHEMIAVFKNGTGKHINNFGLGENGRYRTNVWDYPGVNTLKGNRRKDLEMHPTVKPVALVADAIRDCSQRGGIILDSFLGSGTTLIAAEKTGRICHGIELEPKYVDVAIRRWQELTSQQAVRESDGLTFNQLIQQQEMDHE